jgi:hypothetical protein
MTFMNRSVLRPTLSENDSCASETAFKTSVKCAPDKRQKDDLSARLQDSVAYWLGGSSNERDKNRKRVAPAAAV